MRQQKHEQYRGYRTAGIRMTEEIAPSLLAYRGGRVTWRLYAVHAFDKAHVTMLTEEGLIPREDGIVMLKALREMEAEGVDEVRERVSGGIHSGEQYLIRKLGEQIGGRMHLARSSGDLDEVSIRLPMRDLLLQVMDKVCQFRRVLIDLARQHVDTVMAGYTHAQHAQPSTWGHFLLSWVAVLERDCERLYLAFQHANRSAAGAAIMTGSDFPINRQRVAELLGCDSVEKNTWDAILSHDGLLETQASLAILHSSLARWSEDLMLFSTAEYGLIEFPDRFCGSSSIMPQKKNVNATQEIKGAAAESVGALMTNFLVQKAPTGVPIMELEIPWIAYQNSARTILRDLDWMIEFMPALKVNKEFMARRAGEYWAQASDLVGALVREKGLPWRTAHQIVGILVRHSIEQGVKPRDVTPQMVDEAAIEYFDQPVELSNEALQVALDPAACVSRRTLYGGPAPSEVARRLPKYEQILADDLARVRAAQTRIKDAAAELERVIDQLVAECPD